ncbi:MAG: hypothetical protein ACR2OA_08825 [Rubripirellula sp.]
MNFESHLSEIASADCLTHRPVDSGACADPFEATLSALRAPLDYPALTEAIVPGDTVAVAVDPNTPQVLRILSAVIQLLQESNADSISVTVGDEALPSTMQAIAEVVGNAAEVEIHQPSNREALRFLGPDASAHPIYLNRLLVDADFVLPITSGRCGDLDCQSDLHGFFPAFSDSASRLRLLSPPAEAVAEAADPNEPAMLLGAQLMMSVTSSNSGEAADIFAGTTIGIRKRLQETRHMPEVNSSTSVVVASLDGNQQQQTWQNVARAAAAAARLADTSGTIVLWTDLSDAPTGELLKISAETTELANHCETLSEDELPPWDPTLPPAHTLRKLAQEYRILLHSKLPPEETEALGMGTIQTGDELANLTRSFAHCSIIRAASFCGATYDWPETPF